VPGVAEGESSCAGKREMSSTPIASANMMPLLTPSDVRAARRDCFENTPFVARVSS
jgi:hypothetical protein